MPDREHTDMNALDDLYKLPSGDLARHVLTALPSPRWYARLWRWVRHDLFAKFEPVEPLAPYGRDAPIPRRIRVHKRAVKLAKYLRWYDQDEAREIYAVAGMLLGFEPKRQTARQARQSQEARL